MGAQSRGVWGERTPFLAGVRVIALGRAKDERQLSDRDLREENGTLVQRCSDSGLTSKERPREGRLKERFFLFKQGRKRMDERVSRKSENKRRLFNTLYWILCPTGADNDGPFTTEVGRCSLSAL